jgi:hypothetical protein
LSRHLWVLGLSVMLAVCTATAGWAQGVDPQAVLLQAEDLEPGYELIHQVAAPLGDGMMDYVQSYRHDLDTLPEGRPHTIQSKVVVFTSSIPPGQFQTIDRDVQRDYAPTGSLTPLEGPPLGEATRWLHVWVPETDAYYEFEAILVFFQVDRYIAGVIVEGFPGTVEQQEALDYALIMRSRLP